MTRALPAPLGLTKPLLNRYLLAQYKDRKRAGRVAPFQGLKVFFDWFAAGMTQRTPWPGLSGPKAAVPSSRS
jgi:hypothetical protein